LPLFGLIFRSDSVFHPFRDIANVAGLCFRGASCEDSIFCSAWPFEAEFRVLDRKPNEEWHCHGAPGEPAARLTNDYSEVIILEASLKEKGSNNIVDDSDARQNVLDRR